MDGRTDTKPGQKALKAFEIRAQQLTLLLMFVLRFSKLSEQVKVKFTEAYTESWSFSVFLNSFFYIASSALQLMWAGRT